MYSLSRTGRFPTITRPCSYFYSTSIRPLRASLDPDSPAGIFRRYPGVRALAIYRKRCRNADNYSTLVLLVLRFPALRTSAPRPDPTCAASLPAHHHHRSLVAHAPISTHSALSAHCTLRYTRDNAQLRPRCLLGETPRGPQGAQAAQQAGRGDSELCLLVIFLQLFVSGASYISHLGKRCLSVEEGRGREYL